MAPCPGRVLTKSPGEHVGFCWFLDVCCFIEEHLYIVYIYNTIYILYINISLTRTQTLQMDTVVYVPYTSSEYHLWNLRWQIVDVRPGSQTLEVSEKSGKKCSSQRGFVLRKNAGGRRICVYVLTSSFYQFHLWYSFIALVIHSHYYIILKWNKQPVGMPPGKKKTLVNCQLSWSPDTSVARGVLQARCGDKNFKVGWLEPIMTFNRWHLTVLTDRKCTN